MGADLRRLVALMGVLGLAACTRAAAPHAFEGVRGAVAARTGHDLAWRQSAAAEAAVCARVDALLASDLTREAAVQIALLQNPDLQATYERLGIAQADLVQAGLMENPVLSAAVRLPLGGASGVGVDLDVAQEFLSLLFLPLRRRVAAARLEATRLEVAHEVLEVAGNVEEAWYAWLGARQVHELRTLVLEATGASAQVAQRLQEAGNLGDLERAEHEALDEEARMAEALAETEVVEARARLDRLMGLVPPRTAWTSSALLPALPAEDADPDVLVVLALERRLDVQARAHERRALLESLRLVRGTGGIAHVEGGASAERDGDSGDVRLGPSISFELPLFDQGQAEGARLAARIRRNERLREALEMDVRAEVAASARRLAILRRRAARQQERLVPLRERIVALTQRRYNYMLAGVFDLLRAREREIEAWAEHVEAVRDYWTLRAALVRGTAGPLPLPPPGPPPPVPPIPPLDPAPVPPPDREGEHDEHEGHGGHGEHAR